MRGIMRGRLIILIGVFVTFLLLSSSFFSGVSLVFGNGIKVNGMLIYNPSRDGTVGEIFADNGFVYPVSIKSNHIIAETGTFTLEMLQGEDYLWQWHIVSQKIDNPIVLKNSSYVKNYENHNVMLSMNAISLPININGTNYTIGVSTNLSKPLIFVAQNSIPIFFNNVTIGGLCLSAQNLTKYFSLNLSLMEQHLLQILINTTLANSTDYVILATNITYSSTSSLTGQVLTRITPSTISSIARFLGGVFNSSGFNYLLWIANHTDEQLFIISDANISISSMNFNFLLAPLNLSMSEMEGIVSLQYYPSYIPYISQATGFSFKLLFSNISVKVGVINQSRIYSTGYVHTNISNLWGMNNSGVAVDGFAVGFDINQTTGWISNLLTIPPSLLNPVENFTNEFNVGAYILINSNLTFSLNSTFFHGFAILILPNVSYPINIFSPVEVDGVLYNANNLFDLSFNFPIIIATTVNENPVFAQMGTQNEAVSGVLLSAPSITSKFPEPFTNMSLILLNGNVKNISIMLVHNSINQYFVNGTIILTRDQYGWWNVTSVIPSAVEIFDKSLYELNHSYYIYKNVQMRINSSSIVLNNNTYGIDDSLNGIVWISYQEYPMIATPVTLQGVFLPQITVNVGKILEFLNISLSDLLSDFLNAFNITVSVQNLFLANHVIYGNSERAALDILGGYTPSMLLQFFNNNLANAIEQNIGTHMVQIITNIISSFDEKVLFAISDNFSIFNEQYWILLCPSNSRIVEGLNTIQVGISNINISFEFGGFNIQVVIASAEPQSVRMPVYQLVNVEDLWATNYRNVEVYGFTVGFTLENLLNWTLPFINFPGSIIGTILNYTQDMNVGLFIFFDQNLEIPLNTNAYRSMSLLIVPDFYGNPSLLMPLGVRGVLFNSSALFGLPQSFNFPVILANYVNENPVFPTQITQVSGLLLAVPKITEGLPEPFTDMALILVNPWSSNQSIMLVHSNLNDYVINGTITLVRDNTGWWNVSSIEPSPFLDFNINLYESDPSVFDNQNVNVTMTTTSLAVYGYTFGINQAFTAPYVWFSQGSYPLIDSQVTLSGVFLSSITVNLSKIMSILHISLPTVLNDLTSCVQVTFSNLSNNILMVNKINDVETAIANMEIVGAFTPSTLHNLTAEFGGSYFSTLINSTLMNEIYNFIDNLNEQVIVGYNVQNTITNMTFYIILAPTTIPLSDLVGVSNITFALSDLNLTIDMGVHFSIVIGSILNGPAFSYGYMEATVPELWGMNGVGVSVMAWAVGVDAFEVTSYLNSQFIQYFNIDISEIVNMTQVLNPALFVLIDPSVVLNNTTSWDNMFALAVVPNYPSSASTLGYFTFNGVVYNAGYFFETGLDLPVILVDWMGVTLPSYPFYSLAQLSTASSLATPMTTTGLITGTTIKTIGNVLTNWIPGLAIVNSLPIDIGIYDLCWSLNLTTYNVPVIYIVLGGIGPSYEVQHVDISGYFINYTDVISWIETLIEMENYTGSDIGKYLTDLVNWAISDLGMNTEILNGFIFATDIVYNQTPGSLILDAYTPTLFINSTDINSDIAVPINASLMDNANLSWDYQVPVVYYDIITPMGEEFTGTLSWNLILVPFLADNMTSYIDLPAEVGTYSVTLTAYGYYGLGDLLATYTYYFTVSLER